MANKSLIKILVLNDLKVTPQRVAILEVIMGIPEHPTADIITEYVHFSHPNISLATIYKTLDIFSKKGIIKKVKTEKESMRYDAVKKKHHHLYCAETDRIEDYYDDNLNQILETYFRNIKIPDFKINDLKLQILGEFTGKESKTSDNQTIKI